MKNNSLFVVSALLILSLSLCACTQAIAVTQTPIPQIPPTSTLTLVPIATTTPSLTPTPTEKSNLYIVKAGDTLWGISQLYGIPVAFIALKNNITNVDEIFVGQEIVIPDESDTPPKLSSTGKQIIVILSLQKLYAYEDGILLGEFLVSTGLPDTPTVLGTYAIYVKYDSTEMSGPGYNLPDVPWTMYFYEGYGIHGTYWHNNFGQPMSHGCINMKTEEAKWIYDWAPVGTPVLILP